jgi:hypothetical protein
MSFDKNEFDRRMAEALEKGEPLPDFPQVDDMDVAAMAWVDVCAKFEKAGFTRPEALYATACTFLNTPGPPPR